jgi:beta-glucosidase
MISAPARRSQEDAIMEWSIARRFALMLTALAGPSAWALAATPAQTARTTAAPATGADRAIEAKVDALLAKMTLDEKVGQLHQIARSSDPTGPAPAGRDEPSPATLIREGRLGSMLNVIDPKEAAALQALAGQSRLRVPLILGYDVIHGYKTVFPVPLGEASSWDPAMAERSAEVAAREAASVGIHWTFAPMVDIARDARWGRIVEGAGEDPFLGSAFAAARVRGFHKGGLAACVKHYVGYGAALAGRDYSETEIPEATLWDLYLPPFHAALEAGAETFMSAFNALNGVPASANRHTLTEILKQKWGFSGFVVSDWNSIGELIPHGVAKDKRGATQVALLAGVDMDMEGRCYSSSLARLVQDGTVSKAALDDAVRRVLRIKLKLALMDKPAPDPAASAKVLLSEEHRKAARQIAADSVVLLKNQGSVLPLSPSSGSIVVIGPLADDGANEIGPWAAQGKGEDAVTILTALRERMGSAGAVRYAKGCEISDPSVSGFAEAVAAARDADRIVAVMGESQVMSGEAASRARLDLPGVQQQLLETLAATGRPMVLVLLNGRPLDLSWAAEHVGAIVEAWFPGTMGGPALADVLFGDVNPSGKLPVTFPRSLGQVPIFYSRRPTGRPASEDRWTSRYIDERVDPLFAFGHGLSYTRFEYSDLTATPAAVPASGSVSVSVKVKNAGTREGREVVQLYVHDLVASRSRPLRELKGFQKVRLAAGEEKPVTFTLRASELGFHDDAGRYIVEPGEFELYVGGSSTADLKARFEVKP